MKINKVNEEFLKLYFKNKKVYCKEVNKFIYLSDSYRIYRLFKEDCILDISKFIEVNLDSFMKDDNYEDGIITNELIIDKYKLRLIKNEQNKVYVNDEYLKLFDNPEVKIKDDHSPVLVYEKGELVGLILPIKEY